MIIFKNQMLNLLVLLLTMVITSCGRDDKNNDHESKSGAEPQGNNNSTIDETAIRNLEPEIAKFNLENYIKYQCGGNEKCIKDDSEYFDTKEKRDKLNKKTVAGLIKALEAGLSTEKLTQVVEEAKKASELKNIGPSALKYHTTQDAIILLLCMTGNNNNKCFVNLREKLS